VGDWSFRVPIEPIFGTVRVLVGRNETFKIFLTGDSEFASAYVYLVLFCTYVDWFLFKKKKATRASTVSHHSNRTEIAGNEENQDSNSTRFQTDNCALLVIYNYASQCLLRILALPLFAELTA
jgi:hypothetical protein